MEESKKKDSAIWVAIIGALGIVLAALIAKIDFFIEPVISPKTEEQEQAISDKQVKKTESEDQKLVKGINNEESKNDLPQFQVCFESIESTEPLKNFVVKYKGYSLQSLTNENGCTNIPVEIINREKSISSYTIRVMLSQGNTTAEELEVGLTEPSTYKMRIKK